MDKLTTEFNACAYNVRTWMIQNQMKLDNNKTKARFSFPSLLPYNLSTVLYLIELLPVLTIFLSLILRGTFLFPEELCNKKEICQTVF